MVTRPASRRSAGPLGIERSALGEGRDTHRGIVVPAADGEIQISWMDVRARTDPTFAEYVMQTADEKARRLGNGCAHCASDAG